MTLAPVSSYKGEAMEEGYPASWVRVALRVSPDGEMHAVGGDRDGNPEDGDCPYPGLDRINARINRYHEEVSRIQADMQAMEQRKLREYEAFVIEHGKLQSYADALAKRLRRAEELLRPFAIMGPVCFAVAGDANPCPHCLAAAFLAESDKPLEAK